MASSIDSRTCWPSPVRSRAKSAAVIACEAVIAVNLSEKLILIGGTRYAGEMKKSVFGILNYKLPVVGVMYAASEFAHEPKADF